MANPVVELWLKLKDEVSVGLGKAQKNLLDFNDTIKSAASKWGAATAAIGAATAGLVASFKHFIDASNEAEMAQVRLRSALRAVGDTSAETLRKLNDQAGALQELSGVSDETVSAAQAMLAQFKLNGAQIEALTPKILDMAMATGTNLETAAFAAGRALNYGAGVLRRYGVALTEVQMKTFNAADQAGRLAMLTEILTKRFDGASQAMGATFTGRLGALRGGISDVHEIAGNLLKNVLTPIIGWVASAVGWFNRLSPAVKAVAIGLGLLASAASVLVPLVITITALWPILVAAMTPAAIAAGLLAAKIILITTAAVGVAAAGWIAGTAIREGLGTAFEYIAEAAGRLGSVFKRLGDLILGALTMNPAKIATAWEALKGDVAAVAGSMGDAIVKGLASGYDAAVAEAKRIKDGITSALSGDQAVAPGGAAPAGGGGGAEAGPTPTGGLIPAVTPEQREALRTQLAAVAADIGMAGAERLALEQQINDALYANQAAAVSKRLALAQDEAAKGRAIMQQMISAGAQAASTRFQQEAANVHNIRQFGAAAVNAMRAAAAEQVKVLANEAATAIAISGAKAAWKVMGSLPFPANIAAAAGIMTAATAAAAAVSALGGMAAARIAPPAISGGGAPASVAASEPPLGQPQPVQQVDSSGTPVGGGSSRSQTINITVPETTDADLARRIAREVSNEMALQGAS